MILDFHTHIYPHHLAERVLDNVTKNDVPCYCRATAPAIRQSMEEAGITHAAILNIAVKPGQADSIFEFATQIGREYASGPLPRLIPFASLHPFDEDWREQLLRIREAGLPGIKLHPDYQGFFIDDHRLEPLYREVARLGLILVFHTGFDDSRPDLTRADPQRIANILPVLETGVTVLAHMGGSRMWDKSYEYLCGRNVYLDTSYTFDKIDEALARKMFLRHGPERILFGTDSPWCDQKEQVRYFRDEFSPGFLSPAHMERVFWENGASLLGLKNDR